jgi:hypothetical protein
LASDEDPLMRYLLPPIVLCGLMVWLFLPWGLATADRGPPPPPVAAWSEAQDRHAVEQAAGAGKLHEDPERHALRQAVASAANHVQASPCNTSLRQALSDTFDVYRRHMAATVDDRVETLPREDGTAIDLSQHFNEPVEDAWRYAETAPCDN